MDGCVTKKDDMKELYTYAVVEAKELYSFCFKGTVV